MRLDTQSVRRVLRAAWLHLVVACIVSAPSARCVAPPRNSATPLPADYWAGATAQTASNTQDFRDALKNLGSQQVVLQLPEGDFDMPEHFAGVQLAGEILVVGTGINQTWVHWRGWQNSLRLGSRSVFALQDLTVTGVTVGKFSSVTDEDAFPADYPIYLLENVESITAADDVSIPMHYDFASVDSALTSRSYSLVEGDRSALEDLGYSLQVAPEAGDIVMQVELASLGVGKYMWHMRGVMLRSEAKRPDMKLLYEALIEDNLAPGKPTVDCWNDAPSDLGYTYRGDVSVTTSGAECTPWADEVSDHNGLVAVYGPAKTGFSSTQSNKCRNPRFFNFGPWCYSSKPDAVIELCDIPRCSVLYAPPPPPEANTTAIAGGAVAAVLVLALCLLGICLVQRRKRKRRLAALKGMPQPWHVQYPFHTVPHVSDDGDSQLRVAPASMFPLERMLGDPLATKLESLDEETLHFKYGAAWCADNEIYAHKLIGEGAHGKVYRGVHQGRGAAFKVLNQLRTLPSHIRFVRKSVLPEILIQQFVLSQHKKTRDNPHLLSLLDCQMFPSYTSLLMLSTDLDLDVGDGAGKPSCTESATTSAPADAILNTSDSATASSSAAGVPGGSASRSVDAGTMPQRTALTAPAAAPAAFQPALDAHPPPVVIGDDGIAQLWSCSTSESFLETGAPAAAGAQPRSQLGAIPSEPDSSSSHMNSTGQGRGAGGAGGSSAGVKASSLQVGASAGAASVTSTLQRFAADDMLLQIIMVSPHCEFGSLTHLLQSRQQIPLSCMPDVVSSRLASAAKKGALQQEDLTFTSIAEEPVPGSQKGHKITDLDAVAFSSLPEIWQFIFKLQMAIQIVDGITALHSVDLVHCDVKLDNVFLTADATMSPFGICAKVADLDTCQDLKASRFGDANRDWTSGHIAGANSQPSVLSTTMPIQSHYTSCLKGTPGYLAPEMITMGRVAAHTDVFSLGITIAIMLSRAAKFQKIDDIRVKLIPDYPAHLDVELRGALDRAMLTDPHKRPSLQDIREPLVYQLNAVLRHADPNHPPVK